MTAVPSLTRRLAAGETLLCGWSGLADPLAAEALARAGLGAVCLDTQHGSLDFGAMRNGITALAAAGTAPLVRLPLGSVAEIGRALDMGAEGLICPMVDTRADAERFARAAKFPPVGQRSWAPHRVTMLWEMSAADFLSQANRLIVTLAMIETEEALGNLEDILAVDGIDGVFVGPNDLSISLFRGAQVNHGAPEMTPALEKIAAAAKASGKHAGIYANTHELAAVYRKMGYRLIASGSDLAFIRAGAAALVEAFSASA